MTVPANRVQEEWWGEPCSTYEKDCAACRAWIMFNRTGKVPTVDEVTEEMTDAIGQSGRE